MNARWAVRTVTLAVGLWVTSGCRTAAHDDAAADEAGPALTADAQAMLSRALAQPDASGLVLDLVALEETGLASRDDALRQMAELAAVTLPYLAAEEEDPSTRQFLGRLSVGTAVLRQWAEWPNVRGLALAMGDLSRAAEDGTPPVNQVVLVVAVAGAEDQNRRLLQGVLALGRAAMAESHGREVRLVIQQRDACLVDVGQGDSFCLRPGNGFILMGAPRALQDFSALPQPSPSEHAASAVAAAPQILRLRLHLAAQGTADVLVQGREALTVAASVQAQSPVLLAKLEQVVNESLQKWDASRAAQRELLRQSLSTVQQQLSADPDAPADMKSAAIALTVDDVMDPNGWWTRLRQSVKTERGPGRYTAAFVVPPEGVKALSQMSRELVSSAGMVASVAVFKFTQFQCRSRQSEVKSTLTRIFVAQRAFAATKDRYAGSLRELGIEPPPNGRYSYCMGTECLQCTASGCAGVARQNVCAGMSSVGKSMQDGFQVCAYGDVDSDGELDIWLIDDSGVPENAENDCK